jgi:hypothetical protein
MPEMTLEELGRRAEAERAGETPEETPAPETEVETPEPEETPGGEPKVTLRQIMAEARPGLKSLAEKYADDQSLLEGIENLSSKLGERDQAAAVVGWMAQNGVTDEDLQRLVAEKHTRGSRQTSEPPKEWDESWFQVDAKGNVVPTADAPSDFEARAARWRAKMTKALFSPTEMKKLLGIPTQDDIEGVVAKTRAELIAQNAERDRVQEIKDWCEIKRDLLYTDAGTITPVGKRVNEILASGELNPNLPFAKQAEAALKMAASDLSPRQVERAAPPGRNRTAPVNVKAPKMTDRQFFDKYGRDLKLFADWKEKGTLPADET